MQKKLHLQAVRTTLLPNLFNELHPRSLSKARTDWQMTESW
jgi:hypothetical protein